MSVSLSRNNNPLYSLLTPIANPILYSWLNENFRSAFREKCCCFLSLKPQQTPTLRDESHFVTVQGTESLGNELGEFNIAINGEKQIVTKRRAQVTTRHLQVYVSLPMDSEQGGDPITQPLMVQDGVNGPTISIIQH